MLSARSGDPITLSIPIPSGTVPDAVEFWLENGAGTALTTVAALSSGITATAIVVIINGTLNTPATAADIFRLVRVRFRRDTAWTEVEQGYQILKTAKLAVMVNTFALYNEALALAASMNDLEAFQTADRPTREAAMAEAFRRMLRLWYTYSEQDRFIHDLGVPWRVPGSLTFYTATEYLALRTDFLDAHRRAQVVQADFQLRSTDDRVERGVIMSREGEIEERFRPTGRPMVYPICRRAMQELAGFLILRPQISRR
jgi:hypothetical protein